MGVKDTDGNGEDEPVPKDKDDADQEEDNNSWKGCLDRKGSTTRCVVRNGTGTFKINACCIWLLLLLLVVTVAVGILIGAFAFDDCTEDEFYVTTMEQTTNSGIEPTMKPTSN